ncbi:hypothetical protein SUNI508_03751 [Seiridium unicorne]|uniref:Uncharacterized protein n=1 Tax=Seiridium unicorne TaxID=138068 RepID=A0ABR2VBJ6_9PEZI
MRFSPSAILLACGLQVASGAAIEARAPVEPRALTCSAGRRVANFNNLPALPVSAINLGLASDFNPYYDLNYTHFSVGTHGTNDNALFYQLSSLRAGPWNWWATTLNGLIGVGGSLPLQSLPPSIVAAAPQTRIKLNRFQFGCGIRSGVGGAVPFDCQVIVRPIEPSRAGQYHICTFTPNGNAALQYCTPSGLASGRGFTFQTIGRVSGMGWFNRWSNLFNTNQASTLITGIDNLDYNEGCII